MESSGKRIIIIQVFVWFDRVLMSAYTALKYSSSYRVPARITNISRDVAVNEGSNVNLMCLAIGRPEASVVWKHHTVRGAQCLMSQSVTARRQKARSLNDEATGSGSGERETLRG
ncbi:hypothetical protein NHX12_010699 [Muraenolepis orangiensis]|uniref:Ig-like domain-containing protein n=1 Tax=Muraenolepis orangiensis TaxID=630683 RepID=A0A9Q0I9L5_9TELE|nr:hypothetical protein NHX12_010699 [Muraenolepis orangiensis]